MTIIFDDYPTSSPTSLTGATHDFQFPARGRLRRYGNGFRGGSTARVASPDIEKGLTVPLGIAPVPQPLGIAVRLPTPDGRHAGHSPTPRCDRQPASFQTDPVNVNFPACEDDAQPEGGMGRGLSGWLRIYADQLADSGGATVDQAFCHSPQPTHTALVRRGNIGQPPFFTSPGWRCWPGPFSKGKP